MSAIREEKLQHRVEQDDGDGIVDDSLSEEQTEKRGLLLILDHGNGCDDIG